MNYLRPSDEKPVPSPLLHLALLFLLLLSFNLR